MMRPVITLFALALTLRVGYGVFIHDPGSSLFSDMKNYERIADAIIHGKWSAYHFFQPIGYPLIIAFLKQMTFKWGPLLGLIQALFSTASLYFIWRVVKEELGEIIALITLGIGTIHVPWITMTGFALAETFFMFLMAVLLWQSSKIASQKKLTPKHALYWGSIFIIAFWLKGTHVFLAPAMFAIIYWYKKIEGVKRFILPAGLVLAVGLFMSGSFAYEKIGKFQMSGSAGGLNFVEGKCPIKWNQDSNGIDWFSPIYYQRDINQAKKKWDHPFTDSSYYMKEGLKCIIADPMTLIMSLEGPPLLFMGNTQWPINQLPMNGWIRLYEFIFTLFLLPGTMVGLIYFSSISKGNMEKALYIWYLPIISLFLCVYIFKSEMRFRIPFDVWFIPVAVWGWKLILSINNKPPLNNNFSVNN